MSQARSAFPQRTPAPDTPTRQFLSVSATARLLGMSEMTLYRAIAAGEFPAVRIRGRLIVPTRAIDEMVEASLADGRMVDAADWVPDDVQPAPGRR
jgi:excisionase family DNA binding protein